MDPLQPITSGMPPVNPTESQSVPGADSGRPSTTPADTVPLGRRTPPADDSLRPRLRFTFNQAADRSSVLRGMESGSTTPEGEGPSRETPEFLQGLKKEQAEELAKLRRPAVSSTSVALTAYAMNARVIGDPLTLKEQELFAEGEKIASATKALLPDGQANVTVNLKDKDLLPAARIDGARAVRNKMLSALLDIAARNPRLPPNIPQERKDFEDKLTSALAPLNVQHKRDRELAKEAIKTAAGLVAEAGNCDEFARVAATVDVGNLYTHLASAEMPFSHRWAVVQDPTGPIMNVDIWSQGVPAVAPRHARHAIGKNGGTLKLSLTPSERDKVRVAAGEVAALIRKDPELQKLLTQTQDKAMATLQSKDNVTEALGGFDTAPSAFSDAFLSKVQGALLNGNPILAELQVAQFVRAQGLGLSSSRNGQVTGQIVAHRIAQAGLPADALDLPPPGPQGRQGLGR